MWKQRCLMSALAVLPFLAAGNPRVNANEVVKPDANALRIVTSFYPMYVATLNIVGKEPGVEVVNLTKPQTGCLHDYQLTTEDMVHLSQADIFVVNGAGMESFLDKVVKERPKLNVIQAGEGIELIKGAGGEGDNPHMWLSVSLHVRQVENIARGLARLDPSRSGAYQANAAAYIARLETLRRKMRDGLKDIRSRDIVTFHEAFPYFAREFGLNIVAVVEREPGSEPSAKELAKCIDTVRKSKSKALFAEPQYPAKSAEVIARETGATVWILDPVVTGPMDANAYIRIMESNLSVLQRALK